MAERRVRTITEPQDLRALAHPLRIRLLGALRLDGPATASALARRFGVTSGLTSYHLRALGERGFVEDDPGRSGGRERWWRAAHDAHEWQVPAEGEPDELAGRVEAARALSIESARILGRWLEKVAAAEPDLDPDWRSVAALSDRWMLLTPDQLARLTAEVEAVIDRFAAEAAEGAVGAEAAPAAEAAEGAVGADAAPAAEAAEGAEARRVGTLFAAFPDDGELV